MFSLVVALTSIDSVFVRRTVARFGICVSQSINTRCTTVRFSGLRTHTSQNINNKLFVTDAADGHYTKIQVATSILIPIGERYQFFVKLDQPVGDYTIRTAAVVLPQILTGYSILSYTTTGTTGSGLKTATTLPAAKTPVSTQVFPLNSWYELTGCMRAVH